MSARTALLWVRAAFICAAATPEMNLQRNGEPKIKHQVVLLMENRAMDHIFGCMAGEGVIGVDGINDTRPLQIDAHDPTEGYVNVTCGTANYVCTTPPGFSPWDLKIRRAPNGTDASAFSFYPYGEQDDRNSYENGARENAIKMFSGDQLPIKRAVAQEFAVFNHMHSAVPSFSQPNHLFWTTGTSCGMATNPEHGCTQTHWPQPTIFDSLNQSGVSFKLYANSTTGACAGDMGFDGIARHKDHCFPQSGAGGFYQDAAAGTLPAFSFMSPPSEACDHPCHDLAKGERVLKDIYEALRAGPGWENTMLFVAYDDGGGLYDHVTPPSEGVPDPAAGCQVAAGCSAHPFDFRRLGIRVASFLISPWVPKNTAIQRPRGPTPSSQYDLTSGIATAKNLFNLSTFL